MRTSLFAWRGVLLLFPFRLPTAKARCPNLPDSRTTTREKGNDFQGWAICTDRGTRVSDGETMPSWGAVARSPDGRFFYHVWPGHHNRSTPRVCRGQESTPTTPLNSRVFLRRFLSLGPMAQLSVIHRRVSSTIPSTRPTFAWALSNLGRTFHCGSPASVLFYKFS